MEKKNQIKYLQKTSDIRSKMRRISLKSQLGVWQKKDNQTFPKMNHLNSIYNLHSDMNVITLILNIATLISFLKVY